MEWALRALALLLLLPACSNIDRGRVPQQITLSPGEVSAPPAERALSPESPFHTLALRAVAQRNRAVAANVENRVGILQEADEALLIRLHLFRHSRQRIYIQTFIWRFDRCGRLLMHELLEAARRGVDVRILVDQVGLENDPAALAWLSQAHPNLQIRIYNPIANRLAQDHLSTFVAAGVKFRGVNQRMHNKLILCDGVIGVTGGRNFEDSYFNRSPKMNFRDRDILAAGPVVGDMEASFAAYWDYRESIPAADLADVAPWLGPSSDATALDAYGRGLFDRPHGFASVIAQADDRALIGRTFVQSLVAAPEAWFVADQPGKNNSPHLWGSGHKSRIVADALVSARRSIVCESPYLVLESREKRLFRELRRDNPDLDIIVTTNSLASTDNTLAYSASYRQRRLFVEELGFRIHEFRPRPDDLHTMLDRFPALEVEARRLGLPGRYPYVCLHGKSFVVDDGLSYIGSFNLDPRSVNLNTEAGLLVRDPRFAAQLQAQILYNVRPGNSWIVAQREFPGEIRRLNAFFESLSEISPLSIWPVRNTSNFELLPGREPAPPSHPDFYKNYRDVGLFPEITAEDTMKAILTSLLKTFAKPVNPLL
ncbi:MAG TPA: phospholipase D family protein [Verrucomicrobiales bacterium]|nr:phospholipase D family protein [Verrucomicrobiales bacterium]